ncbi:hypothetical protein AgCh_014989 [Apium graveolens]
MQSLEELNTCGTEIEELPDSIGLLNWLKVLDVDNCSKLERLPEQLGEMHCLEELYASFTAIEELPDSVGLLSKLQVAVFRIDLPDTANNMKLEVLCLRCNIRLWMPMMLNLPSLENLYIADDGQCVSLTTASNPSKGHNLQALELPLEINHMVLFDKVLKLPDLSSSEQKELSKEMCINLESFPPLPPHL